MGKLGKLQAIDEEGTLRLKGKNESDHNTITFEVTGKIRKKNMKEDGYGEQTMKKHGPTSTKQ